MPDNKIKITPHPLPDKYTERGAKTPTYTPPPMPPIKSPQQPKK